MSDEDEEETMGFQAPIVSAPVHHGSLPAVKSSAKKKPLTLKRIPGHKGFRTRRKDDLEKKLKEDRLKGIHTNVTVGITVGAPESGNSIWQSLRLRSLKRYRGKFLYKLPIFNFFYGFYDIESDPPEWSQFTSLVNVLAIVNALLFGLVCTFYSTVDYEETYSAELRFSWGSDHTDHPAFRHPDPDIRFNARYFQFPSPDCFGPEKSEACLEEWREAGEDTTGWYPAVPAPVNATVEGSPYYPWCSFPCYAARPYSGDDVSDSIVTGAYAESWAIRRVWGFTGEDAVALAASGDQLDRFKICRESESPTGYLCKHVQSPTEEFANWSAASASLLSLSLLMSVLVLGTGSANPFAKDQEGGASSYQYRTVVRAYLYWVRFVNLGIILGTIFGTIAFVQALKAVVYVKYTDAYIEEHRLSPSFGSYFGADSPHIFVSTATIWFVYIPIFVGALVLSVGTGMLHSFPSHSVTDLNNVKSASLTARRKAHADDLADFLEHVGGLPRFHSLSVLSTGFVPQGPRMACPGTGSANGFRADMGVTLKGAGGDSSYEASTVADALVDAGIFDVRTLCRLVLHEELGGLGDMSPLYSMSRLTPGAVLAFTLGIRKFAAINATDNPEAGEDEDAEVTEVRIPTTHIQYVMQSYRADGKPLAYVPTLPDIWNNEYENGGWKQKAQADTEYNYYVRSTKGKDAGQAADDAARKDSAKLKIDAVVLWWMEKLRTEHRIYDDGTQDSTKLKYLCKPRVPDGELFPIEHKAVQEWLMHEKNTHMDPRMAFIKIINNELLPKGDVAVSKPDSSAAVIAEPTKYTLDVESGQLREQSEVETEAKHNGEFYILDTSPFLREPLS